MEAPNYASKACTHVISRKQRYLHGLHLSILLVLYFGVRDDCHSTYRNTGCSMCCGFLRGQAALTHATGRMKTSTGLAALATGAEVPIWLRMYWRALLGAKQHPSEHALSGWDLCTSGQQDQCLHQCHSTHSQSPCWQQGELPLHNELLHTEHPCSVCSSTTLLCV